MTAREIIAELRLCGPQSLAVILHFLADRAYEFRLADGKRITDVIDAAAWLRELAEADKVVVFPEITVEGADGSIPAAPSPASWQLRRDHSCDDCRHEHQGKTECGHYLGEGKFCHCESKVTA